MKSNVYEGLREDKDSTDDLAKQVIAGPPIRDERVRGRLGELFAKARLRWRETDSNQHEALKEERPMDIEHVRRRIRAKLARLAKRERGGNSGEPTGT
jgi:hypothetical protein